MLDLIASRVTIPTVVVVALVLVVILLIVVIWSIRRHRDPKLEIDCDAPLAELMPSLSGLTQSSVYVGNTVELFENGAFFDAMFDEIRAATRTVHFETFLWKEGVLGRRLVDALIERRRAGVTVRVLVDANGGKKMGRDAQRRLRRGRLQVRAAPSHATGATSACSTSATIASWSCSTAASRWSAGTASSTAGSAMRRTASTCATSACGSADRWCMRCRPRSARTGWKTPASCSSARTRSPSCSGCGDVDVHVASLKPEGSAPAVKVLHHLVVCVARKSIRIQNPYFLPDDEAIEALGQAVRRGRRRARHGALGRGVGHADRAARRAPQLPQAAGSGGVRIFEFETCLLHQKVMTVDGVWCAIGSSNFDDRSFETNDEITLGIRDATLAQDVRGDLRARLRGSASSWSCAPGRGAASGTVSATTCCTRSTRCCSSAAAILVG